MNRIIDENKEIFENYIKSIMNTYDVAGLAVSIVEKNGTTAYENFFGKRNEDENIDENTLFGLASITKSFTALAIMQLHEKGIINVFDPVKNYIPEFTNKNQDTILIWHLLTHSAGFFPLKRILVQDIAKELNISESDGDFAYSEAIAVEGIKIVAKRLEDETSFTGLPGDYASYSNDCFALLSDIIRRYGSEDSYAEYLNKYILKPLAMDNSNCEFIKTRDGKNTSLLYYASEGKRLSTNDFYDNAFVLMGGGAMKSTISDMKKYLLMYLNTGIGINNEYIASERSILKMCEPRIYFKPQISYCYGLTTKSLDDLTIVEHGGSLTGVSSNMSFSKEAEAGVIVLCNTSNVPVNKIADAAMRLFNGTPNYDDSVNLSPWSKEDVESACGDYISGEGTRFKLTNNNGEINVLINNKETIVKTVNPFTLVIVNKMMNTPLEILKNREKGVWGIRYGGRIIPKAI